MATQGYEQALVADDAAGWAFFALARGSISLERGLLDEAIRWFTEANGLFKFVNHQGPMGWGLLGLTLSHALQGEVGPADVALSEELATPHPADYHGVNRERAKAWLAVAKGHPSDARSHLEDGWALAYDRGEWPLAAMILHDLARLGQPDEERAALIVERGIGDLGIARMEHVIGLAAGDLDEIGNAADAFGAMGACLLAAEAAFGLAAEHRRRGSPRDATAWTRKATAWADSCPGARTPGLAISDEPVALTKREREVAVLAASGITSKDIAERLFVSVRTVDNHLGRVYDKLGIASRAELAEILAGDT
jgi:DNA-binding CsgD family transcriptional regulator